MRSRLASSVFFASALTAIPARANLIITPTFDSSITSSVETTIESAITVFESTYTNPINVSIYFQACSSSSGCLGESNFSSVSVPYQTFYNHLVATNANPAAIAGLGGNGGTGPNNPVTGTPDIDIKPANALALGISAGNASTPNCYPTHFIDGSGLPFECGGSTSVSPVDGIVSLGTSMTYPPLTNNGSNYGLMSTVEHEIDEILGLGSALNNTTSGSSAVNVTATEPAPEDLFRYNSGGTRAGIFSVNCAAAATAFFSYNGSVNLAQFNNACNGGDFGDWQSDPLPAGVKAEVQDAFATAGNQPLYGVNEIAALSAIGYTVAPEPGTWLLLLTALPAFGLYRNQRR